MSLYLAPVVERTFPRLTRDKYTVTSRKTLKYNCIAHAAGCSDARWWPLTPPLAPGFYWPPGTPDEETYAAFADAFAREGGYLPCAHGDPEVGVEKIALYEKRGKITHAARQLPDGLWTSKLGRDHDITHSTPESLFGSCPLCDAQHPRTQRRRAHTRPHPPHRRQAAHVQAASLAEQTPQNSLLLGLRHNPESAFVANLTPLRAIYPLRIVRLRICSLWSVWEGNGTAMNWKALDNYIDGAASIFAWSVHVPKRYQYLTPDHTDEQALERDWQTVGQDLGRAMIVYLDRLPEHVRPTAEENIQRVIREAGVWHSDDENRRSRCSAFGWTDASLEAQSGLRNEASFWAASFPGNTCALWTNRPISSQRDHGQSAI